MVFDVPMAYDYMYTAFTGVALFLVTLQILKPLNFNQNFAILQSSLKYAAATVFWYIIIFTIMLTAFGTLAYALMGPLIRDFRDLKYAYVTLFGKYLCVCVCAYKNDLVYAELTVPAFSISISFYTMVHTAGLFMVLYSNTAWQYHWIHELKNIH